MEVTRDELMKIEGYSKSTFYERRKEILASPFADAITIDGNHTTIELETWKKFKKWRSKKKIEQLLGI